VLLATKMKWLHCSGIFASANRNVFVKQSNGTYIDIGDVIRTALLITFFLTGWTSLQVQNNPFGTEFTTLYQMQQRQVNHSQFFTSRTSTLWSLSLFLRLEVRIHNQSIRATYFV